MTARQSSTGSGNRTLSEAKAAKQDEFYTQLPDITNELKHYKDQLWGKVVLCNCDDPYESNFFQYFALNFNELGLKKLICTSYAGSPIVNELFPVEEMAGMKGKKEPYLVEINEVPDLNDDGAVDRADIDHLLRYDANTTRPLRGSDTYGGGDFRSPECVEVLKQADVVVTNPPFSVFREYVAQLSEHGKDFLILGSMNAITYKEVFKLIKENSVWLGYNNGPKTYQVPGDYTQDNTFTGEDGKRYAKMGNTVWFTSIDITKRHVPIKLFKKYSPEAYPRYDNYAAVEVGRVADIPVDWTGAMGVPISFLDKYSPEQFEILGRCENEDLYGLKTRVYTKEECQEAYRKRFNRKGTYDMNSNPVLSGTKLYQRLFIKWKRP